MSLIRNMPEPAGRELGAVLAKWADDAQPEYAAAWAKDGFPVPQRCATCAFRLGTFPNGCVTTTMDALKCVMEFNDFRCHDKNAATPGGQMVCVGWAMLVGESVKHDGKPLTMQWPYSDEMEAKP